MYKINKIDFWCVISFIMIGIFMTGYTCPVIKDVGLISSILLIIISSIYLGNAIKINRKNWNDSH